MATEAVGQSWKLLLNQNAVLPVEACSCRGLYHHQSDQDGWLRIWIFSLAEPHWSVKDAGRGIMLWFGHTTPAVARGLLLPSQQSLFWMKPNYLTLEGFKIKQCVFQSEEEKNVSSCLCSVCSRPFLL